MKEIWIIAIALFSFSNVRATHTKRHALIVAIDHYQDYDTTISNINSLRDVPLIMHFLAQNNFKDTLVLRDQECRKTAIMYEIQKLIGRVDSGDMVVMGFCSHGLQYPSLKGDDQSGAGEGIVPWGTEYGTLDPNSYLNYHDLKEMCDSLRGKLGPKGGLFLFFDACHSGGLSKIFDTNDEKLSPYVSISACESTGMDQESHIHKCGSLSFALYKAFKRALPGETYESLFNKVFATMSSINKGQHVIVRGNINQVVFSSKKRSNKPYFMIDDREEHVKDKHSYIINGGLLQGLTLGTTLVCYRATNNTRIGKKIFETSITKCDIITSTVEIGTLSVMRHPSDYRFYIKKQNLDAYSINVSVDSTKINGRKILDALKALKQVKIDCGYPDLSIFYDSVSKNYHVLDTKEQLAIRELSLGKLKDFVSGYTQFAALKNLGVDSGNQNMKFALCIENNPQQQGCKSQEEKISTGYVSTAKIKIRNEVNRTLCLNLLEFRTNGTIRLLLKDKIVEAKDTFPLIYDCDDIPGENLLMAISSTTPLSLDALKSCVALSANNYDYLPKILGSSRQMINHENEFFMRIIHYKTLSPTDN